MNDVDQLVAELDGRGEPWDLYRLFACSGWGVTLGASHGDPLRRTVTANTIGEALQLAVESKRMPTIPPRPTVPQPDDFTIAKHGRWWRVAERADSSRFAGCRTRREAAEFVHRYIARQAELAAEWDSQWGPVIAGGVEGVDYVRADR